MASASIRHLFLALVLAATAVFLWHTLVAEDETMALRRDLEQALLDSEHVRSCYYAREHEHSIFNAGFIRFLHDYYEQLPGYLPSGFDPAAGLQARHIRDAATLWNDHFQRADLYVYFDSADYRRLLALGDDSGHVDQAVLNALISWMHYDAQALVQIQGDINRVATLADSLNPSQDTLLQSLLGEIAQLEMGQRLLQHAIDRGITIYTDNIAGPAGYLDTDSNRIIIDKTVTYSEFKHNILIHELVHAVNPRNDNSVLEETLAEIIGMTLQDRLTGIPLGCHPYYVFVDRLLSREYGRLPLTNGFANDLAHIGLNVDGQFALSWE